MLDYPIKFYPILKEKIWGGTKLQDLLNKSSESPNIGESWELSSVQGNVSKVANGELKGKSLSTLIKQYKEDFVGDKVYQEFGNEFPLLFKFIDAKENLSVQLHPNDKIANERHNSFGKTEMWYVVNADENSQLNVGFSEEMSTGKYIEALTENTILNKLNFETVKKGDAFFIKEGLVHAIGSGCLIAEIQQTSDITYRIYDWDRIDAQGKQRELHTKLALEALDYTKVSKEVKCDYDKELNTPSNIISCKYFTTNYINVNNLLKQDYSAISSFVVLMCVSGSGEIHIGQKKETITVGETILIPALINQISIKAQRLELLEIYIDEGK